MDVQVKVDAGRVTVALGAFRAGLEQRAELLKAIGAGQLQSIYRTFAEEGSPAGSWPKLAASTLKKKGYGAGHKLLILHGLLRNSIHAQADANSVTIGTNVKYARVHQLGSADRGVDLSAVENPLQFLAHVKGYSRRQKSQDQVATSYKGGRIRTRLVARGIAAVGAHSRRQNIPARPFLVFRPEDPARIKALAQDFIVKVARSSGLEAK